MGSNTSSNWFHTVHGMLNQVCLPALPAVTDSANCCFARGGLIQASRLMAPYHTFWSTGSASCSNICAAQMGAPDSLTISSTTGIAMAGNTAILYASAYGLQCLQQLHKTLQSALVCWCAPLRARVVCLLPFSNKNMRVAVSVGPTYPGPGGFTVTDTV